MSFRIQIIILFYATSQTKITDFLYNRELELKIPIEASTSKCSIIKAMEKCVRYIISNISDEDQQFFYQL